MYAMDVIMWKSCGSTAADDFGHSCTTREYCVNLLCMLKCIWANVYVVQTWKMSSTHNAEEEEKKRYKNASVSMCTLRWLYSASDDSGDIQLGPRLTKAYRSNQFTIRFTLTTIPNRLRTYTRPLCAGNEKVFSWS